MAIKQLKGDARYMRKMGLICAANYTIRLAEIGGNNLLAEQTILSKQTGVSFVLCYDDRQIVEGSQYGVTLSIDLPFGNWGASESPTLVDLSSDEPTVEIVVL